MGNGRTVTAGFLACAALLLSGCAIAPSFSEDEKRQMRNSASQYQRAALEDLVVTEVEYRDAISALRDCFQNSGFGVGPLTVQDGNQLGFQSSYSGDRPPFDQDAQQLCNEEFITEIGPVWVSQRTPLTS